MQDLIKKLEEHCKKPISEFDELDWERISENQKLSKLFISKFQDNVKWGYRKVKKGDIVNVVFSVGVKHPLYEKPVSAKLDAVGTGYDGFRIYATTIDKVHHPEDPEGILEYKHGKFVGYSTRPAYDKYHSGYIEKIIYEDGVEVNGDDFRKILS